MKLYYSPNACSLASHIALEEVGATHEAIRVNFSSGEQNSPDFLAINPKGRVPALVTERGIITETPAILVYIAQSFPDAGLAPLDDPFAFAQVQSFNAFLCATLHVSHAHLRRPYRWADDAAAIAEMKRKAPEVIGVGFAQAEAMLQGPWVMGERYTICDPYLYTIGRWLEGDNVDPVTVPRLMAHRARMESRPAVQRALTVEGLAR